MLVLSSIDSVRSHRSSLPKGTRVGFVPTMGYLHDGHGRLIQASKKNNDLTVVSIFVNPLQFGPKEDLANYPRDIERDKQRLETEGVDVLFLPSVESMYPELMNGLLTRVAVDEAFSSRACGAFRPDHFEGVATVVLKLFNIVAPCNAYFGLKDYQQFVLIMRMIDDFNLDVRIHGLPTLRENDGLAMSSRNSYLSPDDRALAPMINKTLHEMLTLLRDGASIADGARIFESQLSTISTRFRVQYLEVYDRSFEPVSTIVEGERVLVTAVYLGDVRLIDNLLF